MTPDLVARMARALDGLLEDRFLGRVLRPDRWTLGVQVPGNRTLGLCWAPGSPSVGLCEWTWPRGTPEEILGTHLKGARVLSVTALEGEPVLRIDLAGPRAAALVWEALGRSANALLLGEGDHVLWSGRVLKGGFRTGQTGEVWLPPPPRGRAAGSADPLDEDYLTTLGPEALRLGLLHRARAAARASLAARERALVRRREAILGDRVEGEQWADLEGIASDLLGSGDLNRRGEARRRVTDYRLDPPAGVDVDLDPALSVRENAAALFRRAQRGKARLEKTGALLTQIASALAGLAQERAELESCEDLGLLIADKAEGRGRTGKVVQRRRTLPPDVASVALPLGYAGYAGKSARGNDTVSFKLGRGTDFWFHAEDYAGCHVVVKNPGRLEALPFAVERAAALYAASHSGAPPGNRVAVVASQCKALRRVPRSPGRVMMSSARRVFVDLPMGR